jgi:hypothetical protein
MIARSHRWLFLRASRLARAVFPGLPRRHALAFLAAVVLLEAQVVKVVVRTIAILSGLRTW